MLLKHDNDVANELLTSSLLKYLRVKSFRDRRKILLRNCLLSLPFFHRVDSNRSGLINKSNESYGRHRIQMQIQNMLPIRGIFSYKCHGRIITWAINLLIEVVFPGEFSSFILCMDPLILENTEGSAKKTLMFPYGCM